jgi:hypothetical protein
MWIGETGRPLKLKESAFIKTGAWVISHPSTDVSTTWLLCHEILLLLLLLLLLSV